MSAVKWTALDCRWSVAAARAGTEGTNNKTNFNEFGTLVNRVGRGLGMQSAKTSVTVQLTIAAVLPLHMLNNQERTVWPDLSASTPKTPLRIWRPRTGEVHEVGELVIINTSVEACDIGTIALVLIR